jgi:hypothetical protein
MTVPSEVRTLQAFEIAPAVWAGRDVRAKSFGTINLDFTDRPVWDRLDSADLQQLLTRHTTLTTLALNSVVLDQAGLDLLLAHPHVVHVTLLAIAATESRVDSPCSWQTLQLAWQVDIRTLAYVPLHSLKQPLAVGSLLLPPDVRTEQLPGLLHQVTEKLAAEWQQVALCVPGWLVIEDHIKPLRGLAPGVFTRNWTPDHCTALLTSLAPLASPAFGNITGRVAGVMGVRVTTNMMPRWCFRGSSSAGGMCLTGNHQGNHGVGSNAQRQLDARVGHLHCLSWPVAYELNSTVQCTAATVICLATGRGCVPHTLSVLSTVHLQASVSISLTRTMTTMFFTTLKELL